MSEKYCCCPKSPRPAGAPSLPWQGVVEYSFYDPSHKLTKGMIRAFEEWESHINLTFKRVEKNGDIRISFEPGSSWSYIGTESRFEKPDRATMNIGWDDYGTNLHEIGHALGLRHEHQSSQSPLLWSLQGLRDMLTGWSDEDIKRNVLDRWASVRKWNRTSIMHYSFPASAIDQPLPHSKDGTPYNSSLNDEDIFRVQEIYGPKIILDPAVLVDGKEVAKGILMNDRVHVPLRFVAEELGAKVIWDHEEKQVRVERRK